MKTFPCAVASLLLMFASASLAAVTATATEKDGRQLLVLENEQARVEVWPEAGGAIASFIDKRSGTDFVAGAPRPGAAGYAWKDVTRPHFYDPSSTWTGAQPYTGELRDVAGGKAIVVVGTAGHLRNERTMQLADAGTALTITNTITNISAQSHSVWARWHPYMKLDDVAAEHSLVLVPGPDANTLRYIRVGQGWESHFMDVPGCWMALNTQTGVGMWMTFPRDEAVVTSTWTDFNFTKHPRRGWFVAEVYPKVKMLPPGESITMHFSFQPIVASDTALDMTHVAPSDRDMAVRFAALARANSAMLKEHTMAAVEGWHVARAKNRFSFGSHRRERVALLDWGVIDALTSVPGDQQQAIRARLFARAFDGVSADQQPRFELTMTDALGKTVRHEKWATTLKVAESRAVDMRKDVAIDDLPDGHYTVSLVAFAGPADTAPVHSYVRPVKLSGRARAAAASARRVADAPPLIERERPVVRAMREMTLKEGSVPIAVEEAGGIARQGWPVRVGVPFAQGALPEGGAVALTSPSGAAVPVQVANMGRWPDGSVRWLLVDFPADVPAGGHVFYTLTKSPTAAPVAKPIAREQDGAIVIDTEARQWKFDDKTILGLFAGEDIWWETGEGKRHIFKLQGEDAGVSIIVNGPQQAVVKAVGWYFAPGDDKPIARGELRAEFARGQSWLKLSNTYTYAGDPWKDTLGSTGITFRFPGHKHNAAAIELDGQTVSAPGALQLRQVNEMLALVGDRAGRRAGGAVSLSGDAGHTTVMHRGLWRMAPKQVDLDPAAGSMTFHYWPRSAGTMSWKPDEDSWVSSSSAPEAMAIGVSRTHEFIISDNHRGAPDLAAVTAAHDEPVLAIVAPRYLCGTNAIHGLSPYDPVNCPELENAVSEIIDSYTLHREVFGLYGQWYFGSMGNMFDQERKLWAWYGRFGNILNEQDIVHGPWLAYLRSGDRKHFHYALTNTTHLMDVGTIRLNPHLPEVVGLSRRHHEVAWLGGGDHGHSMLDPFLEMYHVTGDTRAWEAAERMAQGMAQTRSGSWRYLSNPLSALSRMYLETGESWYKQQADRIFNDLCKPDRNTWYAGDHGSRAAINYSQISDECLKLFIELPQSKPGTFETLDALAEHYRRTGDAKYIELARKSVAEQIKLLAEYDYKREDPMFWSTARHTQFVMATFREFMYASTLLSKPAEPPSK